MVAKFNSFALVRTHQVKIYALASNNSTETADRDGVYLRKRIASRNTTANAALKRLASLAGIEPDGLSTHVARHSFADYARRQTGDLYAISKSLGHGNLSTTETYLRSFDRDAVDGLATRLWG